MSKNGIRRVAAIGALAALVTAGGAAGVSAQPSGSAGIDTGSAGGVIDTGSGILNSGSGVLDSGSAVLDGLGLGLGLPDTGSGGGGGTQTQQCNQTTQSGHDGITTTRHELGRSGPTSFVLAYETFAVPDLIEVFYEGSLVRSTGWVGDNTNEGTGSVVVTLPPGAANAVTVRVNGGQHTDWQYVVNCPR
ncbi:hypothetical protein AB0H71_25990 [Nocardia sp. NPDC050697]|uniref:hypothetical protein n=1 Tax=Nocardia sp. NPDC050697 TaxID=3155158 RepID=UPI00340ABDEA